MFEKHSATNDDGPKCGYYSRRVISIQCISISPSIVYPLLDILILIGVICNPSESWWYFGPVYILCNII